VPFELLPPSSDISLVPATTSDESWLYRVATVRPESWPRLCSQGTPPLPEFRTRLWTGTTALYRVDYRPDSETQMAYPLGMLGIYNLNQASGVAWLDRVGLADSHQELMSSALRNVIAMAKKSWPLRRIFFEYYDCVPSPISGMPETESHGRLRDHGFFYGQHWDLVFESIPVE
jgi:hypothetical protein